MESNLNELKLNGFINYFGMQRFGTGSIPTHHIGRALLRGDWREAVALILKPRSSGTFPPEPHRFLFTTHSDHLDIAKARQAWLGNDLVSALELFPPRYHAERTIISSLQKYGSTSYSTAFSKVLSIHGLMFAPKLPRNQRWMYVHAYQSFIWNSVVSERVRLYGTAPAVGDLVMANGSQTISACADIKVTFTSVFELIFQAEVVNSLILTL